MFSRGAGRDARRVKSYEAPGNPAGAKKLSPCVRGVPGVAYSEFRKSQTSENASTNKVTAATAVALVARVQQVPVTRYGFTTLLH